MQINMRTWRVGILVLAAAVSLGGCRKSAKATPHVGQKWQPTMSNPAVKSYPICEPKTLDEMEDDDVIVAVNGVALTKADFGLAMKRYWWNLQLDKVGSMKNKEQSYRVYGRSFIDSFVGTQLFVWEAREQRLLTERMLLEDIDRGVANIARRYRCSPKVLYSQIPGGANELRRSLEDTIWASAYVASNVTATVTVSDAMVSNIIAQIDAENAAIAETNAVRLATVREMHRRVTEGGEDFGTIVDNFGGDEDIEKGKNGYWDNYSTAMDVPDLIVRKVFPLPKGGVSEVLEDDEGFYFIKVLERTEKRVGTNDTAEVVVDYDLGRYFQPREESVQLAFKGDPKAEFQKQFQNEANAKRLEELKQAAEIVYPYGTNFWSKAVKDKKAKKAKLSKRDAKTLKVAKKVKKQMKEGKKPKAAKKRTVAKPAEEIMNKEGEK